jgi:hypothetical protein
VNVIVFVGPSLARDEARAELDATYLPPASQGDVYLAARERPWAIGLIDGYFKQVPAVWHKEILWAMAQGVHVFGAASMGALRAAELNTFGMVGVGRIYVDFAQGRLEDDDEVAIAHADAELDYRTLSDAMVNIRASLTAARDAGVIDVELTTTLIALAKQTFYPRRSYEGLLKTARARGLPACDLERLARWLGENRVDQKRLDALQLLRTLRERMAEAPAPLAVSYRFQHTDAWEQVRRQIHLKPLLDTSANAHRQGDAVLSELRLRGPGYTRACEAAFQHVLSQELAAGAEARVDDSLLAGVLDDFRIRHGLLAADSVEPWLREQGLDVSALTRLLLMELNTARYRALFAADCEQLVVQHLRVAGEYAGLDARALAKQELLHRLGMHNPSMAVAGIDEGELWDWYFGEYLGGHDVSDPENLARELGVSLAALRRDVLREWLYQRHLGDVQSP